METYRSKTRARWGPTTLRFGDAPQTPARMEHFNLLQFTTGLHYSILGTSDI